MSERWEPAHESHQSPRHPGTSSHRRFALVTDRSTRSTLAVRGACCCSSLSIDIAAIIALVLWLQHAPPHSVIMPLPEWGQR